MAAMPKLVTSSSSNHSTASSSVSPTHSIQLPYVVGKPRLRASTPRTKSGCVTCRARRVKCGEEKPSCRQCTNTGRQCEGYISQHSEPTRNKALRSIVVRDDLQIQKYAIPFKIPGSQWERHILHYFCVRGAKELSGWTKLEFYQYTVLQMSQNEAVVRNSLLALAAVHLDLVKHRDARLKESERPGTIPSTSSLVQYNKAVRQLRRYIAGNDEPSQLVVMISCALFYSFENICANYGAALEHLRNGLLILQGSVIQGDSLKQPNDPRQPSEFVQSVAETFRRMDFQVTVFNERRIPMRIPKPQILVERSIAFQSLGSARTILDFLQHEALRFLTKYSSLKHTPLVDFPATVVQKKEELLHEYNMWFDVFKCLEPRVSNEDQLAAAALEIHYRYSKMLLTAMLPDDSSMFSGKVGRREMKRILDLARKLSEHECVTYSTATPTFSSESGIIIPLTIVTLKTHDEAVRQRAVRLLEKSGRREGPLDSQMFAGLLRRISRMRGGREIEPMSVNPLSLEKTKYKESKGVEVSDDVKADDIVSQFRQFD